MPKMSSFTLAEISVRLGSKRLDMAANRSRREIQQCRASLWPEKTLLFWTFAFKNFESIALTF